MIERTIDINGEINEQLIVRVVNELREIYEYDKYLLNTFVNPSRELISTVTLHINSPGGSVDGFSRIKTEIDKLKDLKINIKTYVTGQACSCAFLILLLGDERDGSDFCMCMNHISTTIEYGKVTANQRLNDFYMELEDKYTDFIVERTGMDKQWLIDNQEIDQWFNKEDCIELGIFTKEEQQSELTIDECIEYFKDLGIKIVDDKVEEPKEEKSKEEIMLGDFEKEIMKESEWDEFIEEMKKFVEIVPDEEEDGDGNKEKECEGNCEDCNCEHEEKEMYCIEHATCKKHEGTNKCCLYCDEYDNCDLCCTFAKEDEELICEYLTEKEK